ncbi:transcription elongation factor GreA [Candidatus Wolfebacteria bacterium RIFCSPLOWO2_01_FULL_38_11]|uniref:Transcription elongation factor GreA n=2 Tax=Candidatus Wolfeibacteriota TaxID=1752735 RepID=A0A0G0FWC5_9BACT|nr:MAG: Transcription elongation factor GreA [Candidatus Wolfebacteria bacterium GW2011_GWC1_37_10]OGM91374.1 MAG: transcription elongation factor GreA [Candidatus Wolfebacteria bacterium RIFCSPLOWO2_01_FULL_38_11]
MKYYLSKERLEELKTELERFKKEVRVEIAERLRRAKEYGDLSENSEYTAAKDEQARTESRIFELENTIRHAVIIKKTTDKEFVQIGSTIEAKKNGSVVKYTIVGSDEAKPEANLISNESPLGQAFIGKKISDVIEVITPGGKIQYKITKIN